MLKDIVLNELFFIIKYPINFIQEKKRINSLTKDFNKLKDYLLTLIIKEFKDYLSIDIIKHHISKIKISFSSSETNYFLRNAKVSGYFLPYFNKIILKIDSINNPEIIVHELLHAICYLVKRYNKTNSVFNSSKQSYEFADIDEGLTQYFTLKILKENNIIIYNKAYNEQVYNSEKLIGLIGEQSAKVMYLRQHYIKLKHIIITCVGQKGWEAFIYDFNFSCNISNVDKVLSQLALKRQVYRYSTIKISIS